MKEKEIKKTALAAMFVALAAALSPFSVPVGAAKCFPVQHMVNVLCAVFLGPVYGVSAAFSASFIRMILGSGTLLAFPGSMAGALLSGLMFRYTEKLPLACLFEVFGTGVIGALIAWPVAVFLMGREVTFFFFVVPFMISTIGGSAISFVLISLLDKTGATEQLKKLVYG